MVQIVNAVSKYPDLPKDQEFTPIDLREIRSVSSTGGEKGVKPARYSLLPVEALEQVAELYARGAEKYAEHNWRLGYDWSKSYDSLMRHANAFWRGEDIDEEMGLPHMAAVAFHSLTLLTFMVEHPEFDDRFKREIIEKTDEPAFYDDEAINALREKLIGQPIVQG